MPGRDRPRLVASSSPLRRVRPRRLLRLVSFRARKGACGRERASDCPELRAWRELVLVVYRRDVRRRPRAGTAPLASARPADAGPCRQGAGELAKPAEVTAVRWRDRASLTALAGYCAVSFLYFGLRLLLESGRQYIGQVDDPQIPIWSC